MDEKKKWWEHPDRPCKGRTSEWFLEDVPPSELRAESDRLVALCMTCPVLGECAKDARRTGKELGHWVQGGVGVKRRYKRKGSR